MKNDANLSVVLNPWNKLFISIIPLLLLIHSSTVFSSGGMVAMDNRQVVEAIYKGFETGDMEAILNNMSEEIVWLHPGNPEEIPFAGRFEGKTGVQRFFDTAFAVIDVLEQKIHSFEASGEKVIVIGYEHMRVKTTGKEYQSNWIHMYTVKDGKAVVFEEFIDTAALVAAFDLK
jgi:uncharacterized protein